MFDEVTVSLVMKNSTNVMARSPQRVLLETRWDDVFSRRNMPPQPSETAASMA